MENRPRHQLHTEFHFWKYLAASVLFGVALTLGTLYRVVDVDGKELTWPLVREYAIVAPATAAGAFFLSWLIPAFNRRFPMRED